MAGKNKSVPKKENLTSIIKKDSKLIKMTKILEKNLQGNNNYNNS